MREDKDNQIERREPAGGVGRRSDIARRGMNAANYVRGLSARRETWNVIDPADAYRSPFELAVEQALVSKGHKVEREVRVARFIIDLAIISEDGRKYDLGVECEGITYYWSMFGEESPLHLDRRALRLKILQNLGWNIHCIQEKEWYWHTELELEKLEAVLVKIRSNF